MRDAAKLGRMRFLRVFVSLAGLPVAFEVFATAWNTFASPLWVVMFAWERCCECENEGGTIE